MFLEFLKCNLYVEILFFNVQKGVKYFMEKHKHFHAAELP